LLESDKSFENYLINNANSIEKIISIKELSRGGESVVYRIEHSGLEEIVAKTTLP
jgi:hypothetical protein